MKIVYYTTGVSGTGRIVRGIAIGNALKRAEIKCEYIILCAGGSAEIAGTFSDRIEIPLEDERVLSRRMYESSRLYQTLSELDPDVLIVDRLWFAPYHFIEGLRCKKIFLTIMVRDDFFQIDLPDGKIEFNASHYDHVLGIEPFNARIRMRTINPIIIRNRDEIMPREAAARLLGLSAEKRNCLIALNFEKGYLERLVEKYEYLGGDGYEIFNTTNIGGGGIFPIVDYFNAFDFVVCGTGYNQFWEVVYFDKEAVMEPLPLRFSDTIWRLENCQEHYFDKNGADQLAQIIINP